MQQLFVEADRIINGDRQDQYGKPEHSFDRIARYWSAYLENTNPQDLDALDVAHMMVLFKVARMQGQKPCRDNYTDAAGYLAIAGDRILPLMGVVPLDKALQEAMDRVRPDAKRDSEKPRFQKWNMTGDNHGMDNDG